MEAYKAGQLDRDFVAVVRFQGPHTNGMPELHTLTPALANLQDAGRHVALVTDGRMSGASGKVPAAIHISPEVLAGGPLGRVRDGDVIRLDAETGTLQALVPESEWAARTNATADLFAVFRNAVSKAEQGASDAPELYQLNTPSRFLGTTPCRPAHRSAGPPPRAPDYPCSMVCNCQINTVPAYNPHNLLQRWRFGLAAFICRCDAVAFGSHRWKVSN